MQILPLTAGHAHAVAALWHPGAQESALHEARYMPCISIEAYAAQLAEALGAGQVIGWGVFSAPDDALLAYLTAQTNFPEPEFAAQAYLMLLDLDVHPSARQQGLARRLVDCACAHARANGIGRIEVNWLQADARAAAVWNKLGFKPYLARGSLDV